MFGCYRRDQAADAETFTAAVTMVLAHYSAEVVKAVTDPFGGLPGRKTENGWSGLPDVAEVKEACEIEAARLARMAAYAKLPRSNFTRLPRPKPGAGAFATIKVHPDYPRYQQFIERTATADMTEWRHDETGLWVSYKWMVDSAPSAMPRFKQFSDDELRNIYGRPPVREKLDATVGEGEFT